MLICVQSAEGEQVNSGDQTRSGGIGKKMKAISLTMRKRMGRQYAKALSEEMVSETKHVVANRSTVLSFLYFLV